MILLWQRLALASFFAAVLTAAPDAVASAQPAPAARRIDPYGDPLPEGAIARFGTNRFRATSQAFAFAPDGKTFASGGDGTDPSIRIWDLASGRELLQCKGHRAGVNSLIYIDKGKRLVSASTDGTLRLWDAATGRELRSLQIGPVNGSLALAADVGSFVTVDRDGTVRVREFATGKERASLKGHLGKGIHVVLCSNGKLFAAYGADGRLVVWDIGAARPLASIATQQKNLGVAGAHAVVFSADGKRIATVGSVPEVIEWNAETGEEVGRFKGAASVIHALAYSPDGRRLVGSATKGVMHLWSSATRQELRQFDLGNNGVHYLTLSAEGKFLVAAQGAMIRVWDLAANKELNVYPGCCSDVTDVQFTRDELSLLICERAGIARRYSVAKGNETATWTRPSILNYPMLGLPDGSGLVTPSGPGITRVDFAAAGSAATLLVSMTKGRLICQAVSGDSATLAGTSPDNVVRFWGIQSGKAKGEMANPKGVYHGFALSSDGKLLAASSPGQPVLIWDVAKGRAVRKFDVKNEIPSGTGKPVTTKGAHAAVFAADGQSLLTVSQHAFLWEVATGKPRLGVSVQSYCAALSPDGCLLALGTYGGAILVIDTATGKELARLEGHRSRVQCLAFAPSGKALASGSIDASVVIWDMAALLDKTPSALLEINADGFQDLWKDLAGADAARAYKALCALAASPRQAASFLKARLLGPTGAEGKRIAQLVRNLDDSKFAVRDKADAELASLDELAAPALVKALAGQPSTELRVRAEAILAKIKATRGPLAQVRVDRALEVLERSGAKEAVSLLKDLAKAAPDDVVRRKANAALNRLERRGAL